MGLGFYFYWSQGSGARAPSLMVNLKQKSGNLKGEKKKTSGPNGQLLKSTKTPKHKSLSGGSRLALCAAVWLWVFILGSHLCSRCPSEVNALPIKSHRALAFPKRRRKQLSGLTLHTPCFLVASFNTLQNLLLPKYPLGRALHSTPLIHGLFSLELRT